MFSFLFSTAIAYPPQPPSPSNVSQQRSAETLQTPTVVAQVPPFRTANGFPVARQVLLSQNEVLQPQAVRPLPGSLDDVPVFNSNSPEAISSPGILLSTFPPQGKRNPSAHLNFTFQGRFDIFAHHVAKIDKPDTTPTLYNGILVYNPSLSKTVVIDLLQAASYLGTPDAPYVTLPSLVENPVGRIFSGPGGRVADILLRSDRQAHWPSRVVLPPRSSEMLMSLPIPVPRPAIARLPQAPVTRVLLPALIRNNPRLRQIPLNTTSSSNARSTLLKLNSSGPIYVSYLADYASVAPNGREGVPRKSDWEKLLINGQLATPRDRSPSPLSSSATRFLYGRVSGVSRGSQWKTQVTDTPRSDKLTIPELGEAFSYGLSTLQRGTFGTGQVQSAPMLTRYSDTALLAHGNYGVHYQLSLPLYNPNSTPQRVAVTVQTPIKQDLWGQGLRFLRALPDQIFFRGTVRVRYRDDNRNSQMRYYHLHQRQGEQGEPLAIVMLQPKEKRLIEVDYVYPPDATPPQVLTVQNLQDFIAPQQSAYDFQR